MTKPLVSIVIPSFNAERFIEACVKSCLGQTYDNVEVLVVDDGSNDGTRQLLRELRDAAGGRLRLFECDHRGAGAARNVGIAEARGSFIQFNDADDLLHPEKVAACWAATDDDVDFAFSDLRWFSDPADAAQTGRPNLALKAARWLKGLNFAEVRPEWDHELILPYLVHPGIHTPRPLHRKEHLQSIGGFDESLSCAQEYEMHLRLALSLRERRGPAKSLRVRHVPRQLVLVRGHSGPRIGNHPHTATARVETLLHLHDRLKTANVMDRTLQRAFAIPMLQHARVAYRQGERSASLRAFALADELDPSRPSGLGPLFDRPARLIGSHRTEQLFVAARRLLGKE